MMKMTRIVLKRFMAKKAGMIVNVGSMAGKSGDIAFMACALIGNYNYYFVIPKATS